MISLFLFLSTTGCTGDDETLRRPPDRSTPETSIQTVETGDTSTPQLPPGLSFDGDAPQNVLMISIDTTRRDYMGRYGNTDLTPFLDELAAEGVALDNHMQCSNWTFHSTTCTLLGRYNAENGFIPRLSIGPRQYLPEGAGTLAAQLGEHGVYSILVSSNGWLGPVYGNHDGYSEATVLGGDATDVADEGIDRLEAALATGVDDWFLHVHVKEPHVPYDPPQSYLTGIEDLEPIEWDLADNGIHYESTRSWPDMTEEEQDLLLQHMLLRYRAEVKWLDDQIRTIWYEFDSRGWLDDTLVVFWTDHGEQFWERGQQTHAYDLYREENDGIAFFWAKNLHASPWTGPTTAIDIAPTVLNAVGGPIHPDMTGVVLGQAPEDRMRHALSVARIGPVMVVRQHDLKMRFKWDSGTVQVYDLAADPDELLDIYDPVDPTHQAVWTAMEAAVLEAEPYLSDFLLVWPEESGRE